MQMMKAKKLWENGEFLGGITTEYSFPCERITNSTPRDGWITRTDRCCGQGTTYQLTLTDPKDSSALKGVWIEYDGYGVLVDSETVADVVDKCNGCCGSAPSIESRYNNVFPSTADLSKSAVYQITRSDNGTLMAVQRFRLDYIGQYVEGSLSVVSANGTTSVYQFSAYKDPRVQGSDTISSEAARVFLSNDPPALTATQTKLELTISADGADVSPVITQTFVTDALTTMTALLAKVNANSTYTALGTYALVGTKIQLTTSKATNVLMNLEGLVDTSTGTTNTSAVVTTLTGGNTKYRYQLAIDSINLPVRDETHVTDIATSLGNLVTYLNATAAYNKWGVFSVVGGNQVRLVTTKETSVTQTITGTT